MVPSFWPTFLHQGQWVTPLKWHSTSGLWMPINPITIGDSDGDTALKNFSPFHKVIREELACHNSSHPGHALVISKMAEPNRSAVLVMH